MVKIAYASKPWASRIAKKHGWERVASRFNVKHVQLLTTTPNHSISNFFHWWPKFLLCALFIHNTFSLFCVSLSIILKTFCSLSISHTLFLSCLLTHAMNPTLFSQCSLFYFPLFILFLLPTTHYFPSYCKFLMPHFLSSATWFLHKYSKLLFLICSSMPILWCCSLYSTLHIPITFPSLSCIHTPDPHFHLNLPPPSISSHILCARHFSMQ